MVIPGLVAFVYDINLSLKKNCRDNYTIYFIMLQSRLGLGGSMFWLIGFSSDRDNVLFRTQ